MLDTERLRAKLQMLGTVEALEVSWLLTGESGLYVHRLHEPCTCGGKVYCLYADWSSEDCDEYRQYAHVCTDCWEISFHRSERANGESKADPQKASCPFCRHEWASVKQILDQILKEKESPEGTLPTGEFVTVSQAAIP